MRMTAERLIHQFLPFEIRYTTICLGKESSVRLHRGYNTREERDTELHRLEAMKSKVLHYFAATNHSELDRMERALELRLTGKVPAIGREL